MQGGMSRPDEKEIKSLKLPPTPSKTALKGGF